MEKSDREQLDEILAYAAERGIIVPADILLDIGKEDTRTLLKALKLKIKPSDLPLFTLNQPGAVPAPKENGLVLASKGWEKIGAHTVYMGMGGGGGAAVVYPITPDLGGTGIANLAASTLTLGAATTITGGGTLALGGFTGGVPATGTFAMGAGTLTSATINDVTGATHTHAITVSPTLLGNGAMQYQTIITGANPFIPVYSGFLLDGTTGGKTVFAVTNTKTLTLTSTGDFNLTVPATGTAALLATANLFTASQDVSSANVVFSSIVRGNLSVHTTTAQAIDIGAALTLGGYNNDAASAERIFGAITGRKANSTTGNSSGYLGLWTNNAGNLVERIRIGSTGTIGIGVGILPVDVSLLNLAWTFAAPAGTVNGINTAFTRTETGHSAISMTAIVGFSSYAGTFNLTAVPGVYVNSGLVGFSGTSAHSGSGIVSSMVGVSATNLVRSGASVTSAYGVFSMPIAIDVGTTAIATNTYAFYARAPNTAGMTYTITNQYGIYIENISLGGTLKYAIYTNAGLNQLGDQLSIVGSQDVIQLAVHANATQTTNLQTWETSGSAVLDLIDVSGNIKLNAAGSGLYVKEGANCTQGVATLVAGTVTVNTTKVTANSRIFLTPQSLGTILRPTGLGVTARVAGTSFTITSMDITDTSTVGWLIMEPA
jgi:hypothetical protein